MRRVPMLSGSRVALVPAAEEDVVLMPPPPPDRVVEVAAAVRDALRFPLSGPPLAGVARSGTRATIVVEPPSLPVPGAQQDPRPAAVAATIDELTASGVRDTDLTILVAGGLGRRYGHRELERLLPPPRARAFRGRVAVHDAEDEKLVGIAEGTRANPALVETDLVVLVGAAETVLHGGPGTLAAACDAATVRGLAGADSLIEAAALPEWGRVLAIEDAVAAVVPVIGLSLVLDLPRLTGTYRGYPYEPAAVRHVVRSPFRRIFTRLPAFLRRDILARQHRRIDPIGAFAGTPSVAHAEALLRGVDLRGLRLDEPVDALVVGAPWIGQHHPREIANPLSTAAVALGLALRLYRDAFPVRAGGTLVLVHPLSRSFAQGGDDPYATAFAALRSAREPAELAEAERAVAGDERAVDAYRGGRACHPLLPYADWAGCAPALSQLGRVVVAGCRDALAARTLGFVPSHGVGSALEMAHGMAGGRAEVGLLLAPPYAPLLVGRA